MSYRTQYNHPAPAYTLVNLSASVAKGRQWELKAYARNLFDVNAQLNTQTDTVTPAWVYTNQPRTIGMQVTLHY